MRQWWVTLLAILSLASACAHTAEECADIGTCPPDAGAAPPPSDACGGTCVPGDVSLSWSPAPWPVWFGTSPAPSDLCAQVDPSLHEAFDGTAPPAPACGVCTCSAPTGSCEVATVTESTASCTASLPGLSFLFSPPSGWDGGCLALPPLSGVVESVTVAPLAVNEACTPQTLMVMKMPHPLAGSYAHACGGVPGTCPNEGDVCVPALPTGKVLQGLAPGLWTYCVASPTDTTATCPSEYPIERDFGNGWTTPSCADCTCERPTGSTCSESLVTFFKDGACTSTSADEDGAVNAQTSMPMCVDVSATPESMTAAPSTYTPGGMCTPGGGGASGPPTAAEPMTFCCQE